MLDSSVYGATIETPLNPSSARTVLVYPLIQSQVNILLFPIFCFALVFAAGCQLLRVALQSPLSSLAQPHYVEIIRAPNNFLIAGATKQIKHKYL